MNRIVKSVLYVVLIASIFLLGVKFQRVYHQVMTAKLQGVTDGEETLVSPPDRPAPTSTNLTVRSNAPGVAISTVGTNQAGATNQLLSTNRVAATNTLGGQTNLSAAPAGGSSAYETNGPAKSVPPSAQSKTAAPPTFATLATYGAAIFGLVVFLGLLVGNDVSHFVADRFYNFILNEDGEGFKTPEYEKAEDVWRDGKPLEAIQLMRDYLKSHPRELYVSMRIAEIYEKDLNNYLAAALEHEEVLKHRLRPEQWGWAAIHLANLYSGKLKNVPKAVALLRRIDSEYGQTAAAVKARARLAQIEGGDQPPAPVESQVAPPPPVAPQPQAPASNLPKGFRPKGKK